MKINNISFCLLGIVFFLLTHISIGQNSYGVKIVQPDPALPPDHVLVTVTPANKKMITWHKQPNANIQYYIIYRNDESFSNEWIKLDKIMYSENPSYTDISNPSNIPAVSYKVASYDYCDNELFTGNIVKPIYLTMEKNVDRGYKLYWTNYKGMNVKKYNIYRGVSINNLEVIDSVASTDTLYIDNIIQSLKYYLIEAIGVNKDEMSTSNDFTSTRSNIISTYPALNQIVNLGVTAYYSKENNTILISFLNLWRQNYKISIFDILGRNILTRIVNSDSFEINTNDFKSGIYIIQIEGKENIDRFKISIGS